jgi:hypothetical protein
MHDCTARARALPTACCLQGVAIYYPLVTEGEGIEKLGSETVRTGDAMRTATGHGGR